MSDKTITVVHKITNLVETVPVDYYEELKHAYRPITKKELDALEKGKANAPEEPPTATEVAVEVEDEANREAQEGAK